MLTSPGQQPQVSGGRLINCYPEPNAQTAGKPNSYWRVPGSNIWVSSPTSTDRYRGGILVNNLFYAVFGTTVYTFDALGNRIALPGSIPGSGWVWCAANQKAVPDIVMVSSGNAFIVTNPGGVANYPLGSGGQSVGSPNCVVYHQSFFIFTYGNGSTYSSDPDSTNLNALNFATAEAKPDTLYRPMPTGTGQLYLIGASTIEIWGGVNTTGYPFSWQSTIYRGVPSARAIAGNEDGWGKGIFLVGDDNKVSQLVSGVPTPISIPDLDQLIEKEPDKTQIYVGVYVSRGHGFVVVQGPSWCWEYDTTLTSWHERRSYLLQNWRGYQPICLNFGSSPMWVCGDSLGPNLLTIDGTVRNEGALSDVQTITTTGNPTGGTFILSFSGQTTTPIPYNATAAVMQAALSALPILGGNIVCTGGPLPGAITATFVKLATGPQPLIAVAVNSLTGGSSPAVAIAHTTTGIAPNPLRMRIETGPLGTFPHKIRINTLELYLTKGVSNALGHPPDETNGMVEISVSRDGGTTWSNPRQVPIGAQAIADGRVRASVWGQAEVQGVRWRFSESAGLNFALMGADMLADQLR